MKKILAMLVSILSLSAGSSTAIAQVARIEFGTSSALPAEHSGLNALANAFESHAVKTQFKDSEGESLYAMPAVLVTDRDGHQALFPIGAASALSPQAAPSPQPTPGKWDDLGTTVAFLPGLSIQSTEWVSASLTVIYGKMRVRPLDRENTWITQEYESFGPSLLLETGTRTRSIGVGMSKAHFITFLWIIPLPYLVTWSAHAAFLNADHDARGIGAKTATNFAGLEGKLSFDLIRFSVGLYERLAATPQGQSRMLLRAGIGLGF